MGEIKFSKRQLEAITLKDSSLMVSAAAGSGKTAVLVERIIRKITEDNVDIDKLLIVTFTNAAAQGMKKKIKNAIRDRIKKDRGNKELKRQLLLVDRANISTVHSFCLDLIKKYPHLLLPEIPSNFSLINETEKQLMVSQILSEIIADLYEKNDEDFIRLTECYGIGNDDSKITELISHTYNFLISIPDYEKWVEEKLSLISGKIDFYKSIYGKTLFNHIKAVVKSAYDKYSYVLTLIENNCDEEVYYEFFKNERNYFMNAINCSDLKSLLSYIHSIEFVRLPSSKKSTFTELIKNARDSVKTAINKLKEIYSEEIIEINLKNINDYDIINKLFETVLLFDKKFKEEKYKAGYLDFNDLEHLCIALLSENGGLKEEFLGLQDGLNEILVDEYQDTNDVQERIFTLLKRDDNLFTVGDIKQSIYRFRHANPGLFLKRIKNYRDLNEGKIVNLNANYRCHPNIVDTVNSVFSFIMSEEIAGIDYKKSEKLIAEGSFDKENKEKNSTDIRLVPVSKEDSGDSVIKEAGVIASVIKNIIEDKDFKVDGRNANYSDITILVRSFNEKTFNLLKILSSYNIPVSFEDKTQFFDSVEIKSFVALLKIIDNPYDDISYIAALRNVFSYTDDELLSLRLQSRKLCFYELHKMSENIKDKETSEFIEELRDYSKKYNLKDLITLIYDKTFYVEQQTGYPNGHKRKENLDRLIDIVSEFEESEYKGLYSFVRYIDRIISEKTKISNPKISGESDTVKVMSIHSSKGLEFPIVILQGADKKFNRMDFTSDIVLSSALGIGYNSVNPDKQYKYSSVYRNIIIEEEKTQLLLEESRILYVALTRAKEKLIITGCVNQPSKEEWYTRYLNVGVLNGETLSYIDFKNINNYLDMILPPLLKDKNNNESHEYPGKEWLNINGGNTKIYVEDGIFETDGETTVLSEDIKPLCSETIKEMDERYLFKYENDISSVPEKISVTEARKLLSDQEEGIYNESYKESIYVPDFRSEKGITSKERGILIHYIFENIDLEVMKNADSKMKVLLDFIDSNQYLKDKLTHRDLKKAESFFESYIGIKMLRAKEVHREREFFLNIPASEIYNVKSDKNIMVQGIIDCYFIDTKGDVYLLDYKYVASDEEKIRKDYISQIKLYSLALSKSLNIELKNIKAYIWNVDKEELIEF